MSLEEAFLTLLIFAVAFLYSCVGQAGASGYLAAMALVGVASETMRPTALVLNILVASIASIKYYRAGAFSWPLFWPLALMSVPFAFLGGLVSLPSHIYSSVVGTVLLYTAFYSFRNANTAGKFLVVSPHIILLVIAGAMLGFVSGLTGLGGGIFLSPVLLFFRWANLKIISGVSAVFILVNSASGLIGVATTSLSLPSALPYWSIAAIAGGFFGSEYGTKRLENAGTQKILAVVLVIAAMKLIL